jgi:hypothetical protein
MKELSRALLPNQDAARHDDRRPARLGQPVCNSDLDHVHDGHTGYGAQWADRHVQSLNRNPGVASGRAGIDSQVGNLEEAFSTTVP